MMYIMRSMRAVACAVILFVAAVAPIASAQPPGFPDLSGFADMTAAFTTHENRGGAPGVNFSTPDGLTCGFPTPPNPGPDSQMVSCDGPFPGLASIPVSNASQGACDLGSVNALAGTPSQINHFRGPCPSPPGRQVLNPGQKVSSGNVTCGVAGGNITACINTGEGEHGFVLQPSGSWTF
jgi:hypothetical protein